MDSWHYLWCPVHRGLRCVFMCTCLIVRAQVFVPVCFVGPRGKKSAASSSSRSWRRIMPSLHHQKIQSPCPTPIHLVACTYERVRVPMCVCRGRKEKIVGPSYQHGQPPSLTYPSIPSPHHTQNTATWLLDGRVALVHLILVSSLHLLVFVFVIVGRPPGGSTTNHGPTTSFCPSSSSSTSPKASQKQHPRSPCHRARKRQDDNRCHPSPAGRATQGFKNKNDGRKSRSSNRRVCLGSTPFLFCK